ncbi:hypothetical protein Bhyg_01411 [Pseudolycoriella hygida]|uniref:Uncharacterized protein n=1 Tax=Pseudolycoriella hygida TaxID=35572 RepID=A0A9Q0N9H0_9DIPT|nr:hypothetical protein Bhyg_01411 [Pseudolycoriella hygida]
MIRHVVKVTDVPDNSFITLLITYFKTKKSLRKLKRFQRPKKKCNIGVTFTVSLRVVNVSLCWIVTSNSVILI